MCDYTPIMKQYIKIKNQYKDKMLFFRIGDFYELFFDDAIEASNILSLTLTSRGNYKGVSIPMAGFPYHIVNSYISKLMKLYKEVVICDQFGKVKTDGLIIRKVVKIFTPGTFVDELYLKDSINNYICSIYFIYKEYGFACLDVCTGTFFLNRFSTITEVYDELDKFAPKEMLLFKCDILLKDLTFKSYIKKIKPYSISYVKSLCFFKNKVNKKYVDITDSTFKSAVMSGACLIHYIKENKCSNVYNVNCVDLGNNSELLHIDINSRKNLELFTTISGNNDNTLLNVIDFTVTIMGKRLLKQWLSHPILSKKILCDRHNAVKTLKLDIFLLDKIKYILKNIGDVERNLYNISENIIKPMELKRFQKSLECFYDIKKILDNVICDVLLTDINVNIKTFKLISNLIDKSIMIKSVYLFNECNIIKDGFDKKIDNYRFHMNHFDNYIKDYQTKERINLKFKSLKILRNKDGYYIDLPVTKKVPIYYKKIKKLSKSIRYVTGDLKAIESDFLLYKDKMIYREKRIYRVVLYKIKKFIKDIQKTVKFISILDIIQSFAYISLKYSWVKPNLVNDSCIYIKDGRHPVVEIKSENFFISNDTYLDKNNRVNIITGANMGGKSTYMRQTALIVLLAYIGSHVPCSKALIGTIDRIFTRIGASDDISNAYSTFMVEMNEISYILKNITRNSLVLIDEIGRGTNYLEGKSLSLAILSEFINNSCALVLFSTHFYEISYISSFHNDVSSICFIVLNVNNKLIFIYKYKNGVTTNACAVNIAKISGLPDSVISMACYYLMQFKLIDEKYYNINFEIIKLNSIIKNIRQKIIMLETILKKINL